MRRVKINKVSHLHPRSLQSSGESRSQVINTHNEFGEHCGAMTNHSGPTQDRAAGKGRVGFLEKIMSTQRLRGVSRSDQMKLGR